VVSAKAWIGPIIPDCLDVSCANQERERSKEEERKRKKKEGERREKERERERGGLVHPPTWLVAHVENEDISCWWMLRATWFIVAFPVLFILGNQLIEPVLIKPLANNMISLIEWLRFQAKVSINWTIYRLFYPIFLCIWGRSRNLINHRTRY